MNKINAKWHVAHPMPLRATTEQRIAWHLEHAKQCRCRPIPDALVREIHRRKLARPGI